MNLRIFDSVEELVKAAARTIVQRTSQKPSASVALSGGSTPKPLYQLLGGKCRFAVACYTHSSGRDLKQLEDSVAQSKERGFRHIRIQLGGYGSPHLSTKPDFQQEAFGLPVESHMDARPYLNAVPLTRGLESEVLYDVPSRLAAMLQRDELDAALVSVTEVLLNDRYGFYFRTLGNRFEGESINYAPGRHAQLLEFFRQVWERSESSEELRQLTL